MVVDWVVVWAAGLVVGSAVVLVAEWAVELTAESVVA